MLKTQPSQILLYMAITLLVCVCEIHTDMYRYNTGLLTCGDVPLCHKYLHIQTSYDM